VAGEIFLIQDDEGLLPMTEQAYDSEDVLQSLLEHYPNLLAGDQIDSVEPRRWILISRELALPSDEAGSARWSVDHLFLDQDGIPTLVEVKRSSDTRIRREVIGQLIEYAANAVVYWPVERIVSELESRCDRDGVEIEETIQELVGVEGDPEDFWTVVETNLQAGRIRLLFVADEISRELKRIIEFLNEQMSPADVFGVEVKQFIGGDLKTLVPRAIGATERKAGANRPRRARWTEDEFFQQLQQESGPSTTGMVRTLLGQLRSINAVEIRWGRGRTTGSFGPFIKKGNTKYPLFTLFSAQPRIEFSFGALKDRQEFATEESREQIRLSST
jgi:hypothetical protein